MSKLGTEYQIPAEHIKSTIGALDKINRWRAEAHLLLARCSAESDRVWAVIGEAIPELDPMGRTYTVDHVRHVAIDTGPAEGWSAVRREIKRALNEGGE